MLTFLWNVNDGGNLKINRKYMNFDEDNFENIFQNIVYFFRYRWYKDSGVSAVYL